MLAYDSLSTVLEERGSGNVPAREHQLREVSWEMLLAHRDHSKTTVLGYLGVMVPWKWVHSGATKADVGDL